MPEKILIWVLRKLVPNSELWKIEKIKSYEITLGYGTELVNVYLSRVLARDMKGAHRAWQEVLRVIQELDTLDY